MFDVGGCGRYAGALPGTSKYSDDASLDRGGGRNADIVGDGVPRCMSLLILLFRPSGRFRGLDKIVPLRIGGLIGVSVEAEDP